MAVASGHRRFDVGRLIMVPAVAAILFADLSNLRHNGAPGVAGVLRLLGVVLVCAFYALLIWCYLRRGPAVATSGSVTAHAAAVAATWLPFALPLLHGAPPGAARQAVSDVLLVCRHRVVGVVAATSSAATCQSSHRPATWSTGDRTAGCGTPSMLGEIVSSLGVAVAANSLAAVGRLAGALRPAGVPGAAGGAGAAAGPAGLPRLPQPHRGPGARRVLALAGKYAELVCGCFTGVGAQAVAGGPSRRLVASRPGLPHLVASMRRAGPRR